MICLQYPPTSTNFQNIFVTYVHHTIHHCLVHFSKTFLFNVCIAQCLVRDLKLDATSPEVMNFKIRAAEYFPLCPAFSTQVQVIESVA
jgi:hypothetical protein